MNIQLPYVLLFLTSVFLSSVSQVLLKKAAMKQHSSTIAEYLNWQVLLGYGLYFGCTLLTMLAYRGIPLSLGPVLETTSYLYITVFGITIFKEKFTSKKFKGLLCILLGIVLYSLS